MALDGLLLYNVMNILQPLLPLRINKIAQISKNEIVFECYNQKKLSLIISCDPEFNRLSLTNQPYDKLSQPSHFIMLLRKYCENGILQTIQQVQLDRLVKLTVSNRNDLGDLKNYTLMLELMGKYANIILVDEQNEIIDAFTRIPPFTNSNRLIFSGADYQLPPIQDRKNPFIDASIDESLPLYQQFQGFSPLLSKEIDYRLHHHQQFTSIIEEIKQSTKLYVTDHKFFHCIELTHLNKLANEYDLMDGFDQIMVNWQHQARLKQQTGDLLKTVTRELKRLLKKLPKLQDQLNLAKTYQSYQKKGNILLTYGYDLPKGLREVTLTDFNQNPVTLELDERLNGIENANRYFHQYQKLKKGQQYIVQQIQITNDTIDYLNGILVQLQHASLNDALEIRQELIDQKLFYDKQKTVRKKEKKVLFHQIEFDGLTFYYGKSNLQNETLTFKFGQKKDSWFHTAQGAGCHVLVKKPLHELTERHYRFAANLAAYYSTYGQSSSVAVNYTSLDQIKRIPGSATGKVQLNHYQTIYIDPIHPDKML